MLSTWSAGVSLPKPPITIANSPPLVVVLAPAECHEALSICNFFMFSCSSAYPKAKWSMRLLSSSLWLSIRSFARIKLSSSKSVRSAW